MQRLGDSFRRVYRDDVEPQVCPHCGRTLKAYDLYIGTTKVPGGPFYETCDCEGARKEREERQRQEREKAQQEYLRAKAQHLLRKAGLGRRFRERTFANFDPDRNRKAYETCKYYAENWKTYKEKGQGLYLVGDYGTGKTHLASAIVNHIVSTFFATAYFGTLTKLLEPLKDAIQTGNTYELQKHRQLLREVDLLVIDDLGKERPTDWVSEELFNLLNDRYEDYKPVIITSNLTLAELETRYNKASRDYGDKDIGSAIVSRLREMVFVVPTDGGDYRRQIKKR